VQREVESVVRGKILVGHSLVNDMKALLLSHPWRDTRDTATFGPFVHKMRNGKVKPRRLKHLVELHLAAEIQSGEHEPAEDARAALALYKLYRRQWEHRDGAENKNTQYRKQHPQQHKQRQQPGKGPKGSGDGSSDEGLGGGGVEESVAKRRHR
jgi:RNA exonuclease 4